MKYTAIVLTLLLSALAFSACSDSKSYTELLNEETYAVNFFLADQRVCNDIPADSVFLTGHDAPYYRLDEDGNVYMQVLDPGHRDDPEYCPTSDQLIYFRFLRYNLNAWYHYGVWEGIGNATDFSYSPTSFRYGNYTLESSAQYGAGVQLPLSYLGIDCEVNLVIKSQYGFTDEIANVVPFMYNIRYFKPQI